MARNAPYPTPFNPLITLHSFSLITLFLAIDSLPTGTRAASIQYDLKSQFPQIGYPGKPYEWTFSPSTFRPDQEGHDASSLTYRVPTLPAWLTFEPSTRTFSGTPSAGDVESTNIQVFASETDDSDSVDSFRLIVLDTSPPEQHRSLASQFVSDNESISSAHVIPETEGPGVRVRQAWSFSVGVEWDTFVSPTGKEIFYSASLGDREPLPDWVTFNPKALTFDGVTPRIRSNSDPRHFEFYIYGSEVEGYASIQNTFSFTIDGPYPSDNIPAPSQNVSDKLVQVTPLLPINVTAGDTFSYDLNNFDFLGLLLNGGPASRSSMAQVSMDISSYPWLAYDNKTSQLSGTPPLEYLHHTYPVLPLEITTPHNGSLATNITLQILPSAFTANALPSLVAPPGTHIYFALDDYVVNNTVLAYQLVADPSAMTITASMNPSSASSWVTFDTVTRVLSGTVPSSLDYNTLSVVFQTLDPTTNATSTSSLSLNLATPEERRKTDDHDGLSHHNRRVLGAVIGVICGAVLLIILIAARRWWCLKDDRDSKAGDFGLDQEGDPATHGARSVVKQSSQSHDGEKDGFETVDLGVPTQHQSSTGSEKRPLSQTSASSSRSSSDAKPKVTFVTKLKALSERSLASVSSELSTKPRRFSGKENLPTVGGRNGGRAFGTPGNRLQISRPMPMAPGSAGKALHIGMRTGTTPPVSPHLPVVPPPAMTSSVSSGSLREPARPLPAVPSSRSMSSLGSVTGMKASDSQGSAIGTDESGQFLEGGIDRSSWGDEPDYVWASGKIKTSPKAKHSRTMPSTGVVPVRSSLDSVVPKRRKDFGPPPRLVTPADRVDPRQYPTPVLPSAAKLAPGGKKSNRSSLQSGYLESNASTKRVSVVSLESTDVQTSSQQSHEEAVITQVTSRHVVAGVAAGKTRVRSPREVTGNTSAGASRPQLVPFNPEHQSQATAQAHPSISHTAVLSGLPSPRGHTASPSELDERLRVGIDYVRHFGMDADSVYGAGETARIPPSISERSWRSDVTKSVHEEQPHLSPYTYHHRNDDISGASSNGNSPSLSSSTSAIETPETVYTTNMQPTHKYATSLRPGYPREGSHMSYCSDTSTRRSTHRVLVGAGQPFNFSIPLAITRGHGSYEEDEIDIEARLDDGGDGGAKQLPDWLRFDKQAMEFWGVPPPDVVKLGIPPPMIGVSVWQQERCLATFMVEVVGQ